ncbi:ATP-dependent DNA ligase [Microbacterium album]|uniref:DNA ligase (ATP) n=1 Tax=Microbacterium album TaxID=2053191 RepID=A0A917IE02_9MICO|nr:ATP-dependent DNA ligase [Microbacterium album]GGH40097.1 ATP-dependent DNA ligase [Microbacterium album]
MSPSERDAAPQTVRVGGRRLRVTNLDKVMYPETGTTKGEVIDYMWRIAPVLLPHVAGRPVTRKRWVDGVGTVADPLPSFFAKDLERGAPEWIPRVTIEHSTGGKAYPLVDDAATLVYLAQVASLELHVPQWRIAASADTGHSGPDGGAPGLPDRLVLDLDPGPGMGLPECAEVARLARDILHGMGLDPLPVTSGSKGIHLYARLPGSQTSAHVSAVAKALAQALEADHPKLVVSSMSKAVRPGRVLVDWSQNNGKKTTIAPYSLRGRPKPWVAAPRTWEELEDPQLRHLRFDEVLDRVERMGDPLAALAAGTGGEPGALRAYAAKRDPARTPEPMPEDAAPAASGQHPRFVIQRHEARRLHFDLRLERDGVLVSWAVPKGVPETSGRNHLAVQTEDHPLAYATFEGEIPRGEYGAGRMTIWDAGAYELEKWRDDELILTLHGRPGGPLGSARLALIRTSGQGEKSQWLLHRTKEQPGRSAPAASQAQALSADGAASSADPADPADANPAPAESEPSKPEGAGSRPPAPMLAAHGSAGLARSMGADAWAEMKWDGVRALGVWRGGRLRLFARSGTDITERYPELTAPGAARFEAADAVVDGEVVALDGGGRPSFSLLQNRMHLSRDHEIAAEMRRTPVRLYLFDVLSADGADLVSRPLADRRGVLERIAAAAGDAIAVPPVFDDVEHALAVAREHDLEGVVAKDPRSPYRSGRSDRWLKLKLTRTQEVVIGGVRPGRGGRSGTIGSLLLGVPDDEGLAYVGRVGTGFSERALRQLSATLEPLRAEANPFHGVPAPDAREAHWVRPELVGEVEFAEWTPGGNLRQARWRGLRPDKAPGDVVREP